MEDTFEDFLLKTESQKEVSLVIVQEDQDIEEIIEVLEKFQYKNMVNLPSLLKEIERPSRVCIFWKRFSLENCMILFPSILQEILKYMIMKHLDLK